MEVAQRNYTFVKFYPLSDKEMFHGNIKRTGQFLDHKLKKKEKEKET